MIIRTYKNGNITAKLERGERIETLRDLVCELANSCELDFIELLEDGAPVCCGNDYAVYSLNIAWREYYVGMIEYNRLKAGYTVRLQPVDYVPQVIVPRHYASDPFTWQGVRGVLYTLCDRLQPDHVERLEAVPGVRVLTRSPQYAPEIKSHALFIPAGITRELY